MGDTPSSALLRAARLEMTPEHAATVDALADAVGALSQLDHPPEMLKRLVDQAIWTATEFKTSPGQKYRGLRWRSRAAHEQLRRRDYKDLRHEHVVERSWLRRLLRRTPHRASEIMWNVPVAVVTKEEHKTLPGGSDGTFGWERYETLELVDGRSGETVDSAQLAAEARAVFGPLSSDAGMAIDTPQDQSRTTAHEPSRVVQSEHMTRGLTTSGKEELLAELRRWVEQSDAMTIGDVGSYGGKAWVHATIGGHKIVVNSDTSRAAVERALAANPAGDVKVWLVAENQRGRVNKVHPWPEDQPLSGWYVYLRDELSEPTQL